MREATELAPDDAAALYAARLDVKAQRLETRTATVRARREDVLTARRTELGRLLGLVAGHSHGGYLVIRFSEQRWQVNVRTEGREYTHRGRELGGALYRAAYRLCYGRAPKNDTTPPTPTTLSGALP